MSRDGKISRVVWSLAIGHECDLDTDGFSTTYDSCEEAMAAARDFCQRVLVIPQRGRIEYRVDRIQLDQGVAEE